jgi:dephospho-CoA kinase
VLSNEAVLAVGLTGGMGSGKSTVADLLVERGAVLIDADRIARQVVEPDGPAFGPLVDRFGPGILTPEGLLDRAALAAIVFPDPEALTALNAITHPAISAVMTQRRAEEEGTDHLVVLDCPVDVAMARLVEQRGFSRADAEARIAAQPSREERRQGADFIIDNGGDRARLDAEVDRVWQALEELRGSQREVSGG